MEFKFNDYVIPKYKRFDPFYEGLALVKNQYDLYGYIDKTGKEVIPCIFKNAKNFSEGLAAVCDDKGKWGYIDKKGKIVIPYQFSNAENFSEGLAAVCDDKRKWGYIDKTGKYIIKAMCQSVTAFKEGYAVGKLSENEYYYFDKAGNIYGEFKWCSCFENGQAIIYEHTSRIYTVDLNLRKQSELNIEIKHLYEPSCGMYLMQNEKTKWGYLDEDLMLKIPFIYQNARCFKDNMAIVEISDDIIGIVNKYGKNIIFIKQVDYTTINDFSSGLAAVKNPQGLWGYIDKLGKSVIPCQYIDVDDFKEGLAGVIDLDGNCHYINKKGIKKLTLDNIYCSYLELDDKIIHITAESEEELNNKKIQVLEQIKEEITAKVINATNNALQDVMADLYDSSKKRKRENKNN